MTTFDGSQPANDSKIRDFPSLVRDNFNAIVEGDSTASLTKANLTVQGGNPTLIANKLILFAKDSNSESALFVKNDADDTLQLTDQEFLGGETQKVKAASIQFGTKTIENNQNAMCTAWGYFSSSGTTVAAYNCSCTRTADPGKYRITFDSALANANYAAVCMSGRTVANPRVINLDLNETKTASKFDIQIRNSSESLLNEPFSVIVFGGQ